ncbi:IniB N-terminal domain-containing protein [Saccharothrix xinjiangensis]|uniref:IniB N-terminal domain-containing protein n=1 Tax=Saccharothrix xinjiangensis TaxID=204798 RepID=A0ABV9XX02_9PSEU
MGTSPNTLHDFVLDLLSDPTALADFQADAAGSLARAGLGDISAADVQEVIPLVLDYAPTGSLPALDGSLLEDLPQALADAGPVEAIFRLKAVTDQLAVSGATGASDLKAAAAGTLSADADGLTVFAGVSSWDLLDASGAAKLTVGGDFSAVNDVAGTLDGPLGTATGQVHDLTTTATGAVDGAVATEGGVTGALPGADSLTSTAFGSLDTLTGVVDGVTGGLTSALPGGIGGVADVTKVVDLDAQAHAAGQHHSFDSDAPLAAVTDAVAGTPGVGGVVSNVTTAVSDVDLPVVGSLGVDDLLF